MTNFFTKFFIMAKKVGGQIDSTQKQGIVSKLGKILFVLHICFHCVLRYLYKYSICIPRRNRVIYQVKEYKDWWAGPTSCRVGFPDQDCQPAYWWVWDGIRRMHFKTGNYMWNFITHEMNTGKRKMQREKGVITWG